VLYCSIIGQKDMRGGLSFRFILSARVASVTNSVNMSNVLFTDTKKRRWLMKLDNTGP